MSWIKERLKAWAFRDEREHLALMNKLADRHSDQLEKKSIALDAIYQDKVRAVSVVDIMRERLRTLNPKLIDGVNVVMNPQDQSLDVAADIFSDAKIAGYTGENDFLADCKALADNKALRVICDFLRRNQIIYTMFTAKTLEQKDAGAWSINGVELVRDQIGVLNAIHADRTAPQEKFDKHEAV